MAPLWVHFPKDENTFDIQDSHMVSNALLVQPITSAGVTNATVYLPGSKEQVWFSGLDFNAHDGGSHVSFVLCFCVGWTLYSIVFYLFRILKLYIIARICAM